MAMQAGETVDLHQDLVSAVTALRLLFDGWHDGIVDAHPGTTDGVVLRAQIRVVCELVDELSRRRPAG